MTDIKEKTPIGQKDSAGVSNHSASVIENQNVRMGFRDGLPIGLGYISVSFAFGLFAVSSGLSVAEAILISLFNLTSAGQLAGVPIIVGLGSPFELSLTQLVINLRYSLMSLSLSQRMGKSVRIIDRFLVSFANTDEVFAVAMGRGEMLGRKYLYALTLLPYVGWTLGTALGACAGNVLPDSIVSALGVAIYAMFIAIILPEARVSGRILMLCLLAAAFSCAFYYIPVLNKTDSGFVIIITAVILCTVFAILFPIEQDSLGEDAQISDTGCLGGEEK